VIAFARKVAAAKEGTGGYPSYRQDGKMPEMKVAYWQTVDLHGTTWRLVIACAQDNIEE